MKTILRLLGIIEYGKTGDITYDLYRSSKVLKSFNIAALILSVMILAGRVSVTMIIPLLIYWCVSLAYMLEKMTKAERAVLSSKKMEDLEKRMKNLG